MTPENMQSYAGTTRFRKTVRILLFILTVLCLCAAIGIALYIRSRHDHYQWINGIAEFRKGLTGSSFFFKDNLASVYSILDLTEPFLTSYYLQDAACICGCISSLILILEFRLKSLIPFTAFYIVLAAFSAVSVFCNLTIQANFNWIYFWDLQVSTADGWPAVLLYGGLGLSLLFFAAAQTVAALKRRAAA